jgi:hypothetical protein
MDHFASIGKAHTITAAIFDDDGASCLVRFMMRPVALKLEKYLNPACELGTRLLQPSQGQFVADVCQPSAGVGYDKHFIPFPDSLQVSITSCFHSSGTPDLRVQSCVIAPTIDRNCRSERSLPRTQSIFSGVNGPLAKRASESQRHSLLGTAPSPTRALGR